MAQSGARRGILRLIARKGGPTLGLVIALAASSNFAGGIGSALAQWAPRHETSVELVESVFVLDPHLKGGRKGIGLMWIPQPIEKICLGKTAQQCVTIDYCIRTTNKNVPMCQTLGLDLKRLPAYPPDMRPKRVLSVVLGFPMSTNKGFGSLVDFFENAPPGSLDRGSSSARIKARVRLTRTADDDQLYVLEILATP